MSEAAPERRDLHAIVTDMRVDVAAIKTRVEVQTGALARLENKLDLGVFREEYERRQKEAEDKINAAVQEVADLALVNQRRIGEGLTWRYVFTGALAILGMVEAILHR